MSEDQSKARIVLVHGAWADGSCWAAVTRALQEKGYKVTAPQFPETSTEADVARLRQVLARQDGPTVVAGHSYGGQIITALGEDAPNAAALVYVAAFAIAEGESLGALLSGPPTPALANLEIDEQGFAWLPEDDFVGHFAADVDPTEARLLHAVQQPISLSTFEYTMGVPAWSTLPTWYAVAKNDEAIPPDAERQFSERMGATTIEVDSGHLPMVTHVDEIVDLIEQAAISVAAAA
jgi:pimeloyl-ACP methyl ester carboxylesterase